MRPLVRALALAAALAPALVAPAAPTAAQESHGVYGAERYFKLDWQAGERRGRPVIYGHLFNDYGFAARDVRLRVEALDAMGRVVATGTGYVAGTVTPGARVAFEVPAPAIAASYRVTVLSFDWLMPNVSRALVP